MANESDGDDDAISDDDPVRNDDPIEGPFLLDVMCGKLAVYLRMCGYDAVYAGDRGIEDDDRLVELAREEGRWLLTRDASLADRVDEALLVEEHSVEGQLVELHAAGVELELSDRPRRCGRCNGRLVAVPDGESVPEYAPDPAETDCFRCRDCGQYFWRGSHWDRVAGTLSEIS